MRRARRVTEICNPVSSGDRTNPKFPQKWGSTPRRSLFQGWLWPYRRQSEPKKGSAHLRSNIILSARVARARCVREIFDPVSSGEFPTQNSPKSGIAHLCGLFSMVVCGRTGGNRSRKLAYLRSNIILSARVARDSATNSRERAGRGQGGPRHVPTPVGAVSAASSVLGSALSSSIGSSTRATANARTPAGRSRARAVASRKFSRRAAQRPRWRDVGLRARRRTSRNHGPTALSQLCLSQPSCASTPTPEIAWCARAAERGARRAPGSPRRWSDFERDRSRPVIAVRFEACDGLAGNSRPTRVEHAQRALARSAWQPLRLTRS